MFMANTYTQIHIQTIFAVQNRQLLIQKAHSVSDGMGQAFCAIFYYSDRVPTGR